MIRIFLLSLAGHTVLYAAAFWFAKNADTLRFFGHQYTSIYTLLAAYALFLSVFLYPLQYVFAYTYWYGYRIVFPHAMWHVQEIVWLSSLMVMGVAAWWFFTELPTGKMILALFFLACAALTILWGKQS